MKDAGPECAASSSFSTRRFAVSCAGPPFLLVSIPVRVPRLVLLLGFQPLVLHLLLRPLLFPPFLLPSPAACVALVCGFAPLGSPKRISIAWGRRGGREGQRKRSKGRGAEGTRHDGRHTRTDARPECAASFLFLTRRFAVSGLLSFLFAGVFSTPSSRYSCFFFTFSLLCFICFSVLSFFTFFFFLCCFFLVFFCFFFSPSRPFDPDQSRPGQCRTCQSRTNPWHDKSSARFF